MDCAAPEYRYDVFLSYSQKGEWNTFVDEHFQPMLKHWIGEELGRSPEIFVDREAIRIGEAWEPFLLESLRASKVMVALWSRQYFSSEFCRFELGFMLARRHNFTRLGMHDRIILPVRIHDGNRFPTLTKQIQSIDLSAYANPFMSRDSSAREQLSEHVRKFAQDVAGAIENAQNDTQESATDYQSFVTQLAPEPDATGQRTVPSLGGAR